MNHKKDNEIVKILFNELEKLDCLIIESKDSNCYFFTNNALISFVWQNYDGWEYYIHVNGKDFIPINSYVFLYTKKKNIIDITKNKELSISNIFNNDGGLVDLIRANKIKEYFFWYKANEKEIAQQIISLM